MTNIQILAIILCSISIIILYGLILIKPSKKSHPGPTDIDHKQWILDTTSGQTDLAEGDFHGHSNITYGQCLKRAQEKPKQKSIFAYSSNIYGGFCKVYNGNTIKDKHYDSGYGFHIYKKV
jgi:hypothetical protein